MIRYCAVSLVVLAMLTILFLAGCGAGNTPSPGGFATAAITIKWPERTRLIPLACESIKVAAQNAGGFSASEIVDRPTDGGTSTITFSKLPVGEITFTATAYPQAGAQGLVQATGTVTQTGQANQHLQISLTMSSTITSVMISPADPTVAVGGTRLFTATAKNADGDVVLVPATNAFSWASSNTGVATIDANGRITGVTVGEVTITATEKESGKSSTTTLTVLAMGQLQEKILFTAEDNTGVVGVYTMNLNGTGRVRLADGYLPRFSPNGELIVYMSSDWTAVWVMNSDGSGKQLVYDGASGEPWAPCFTHDSQQILFDRYLYDDLLGQAIYDGLAVINLDGGGLTQLTNTGEGYPSVSPDGSKIACLKWGDDYYGVWIMDADGTHQKELMHNGALDRAPRFLPTGLDLIYAHADSNSQSFGKIVRLGVDDGQAMTVTADGRNVAVSPDGDKLVLLCGPDTAREIEISDLEGNILVTVLTSNASGLSRLEPRDWAYVPQ